jgi:hypothetical protein
MRKAAPLGIVVSVVCLGQITATWHDANQRNLEPSLQPTLSVRDDDLKATVDPSPFPFILTLRSAHEAVSKKQIALPYEVAQVDELRLWRGELIVRGMFNNAAAVVVIFDKNTGKQLDEFFGYWPNVSVETGLIIFTKIYPAHFADGTEDHYMVYRLDGTAASNRPPGIGPDNKELVGYPLYPLSVGNRNFDNTGIAGAVHAQLAYGFFWNAKGDQAVTLDGYGDSYRLVLMQFGPESARIKTLELSSALLCAGQMEALCRPDDFLEYATFGVDKDGKETVVATFGYPQKPPGTVVTVPVAKFVDLGTRSLSHPQWNGAAIR